LPHTSRQFASPGASGIDQTLTPSWAQGVNATEVLLTSRSTTRPRWGDYSASVTAGNNLWFATEWIGQRCSFTQYQADTTCGGTRGALGNWSTHLARLGT
jgi:hypothetical protein